MKNHVNDVIEIGILLLTYVYVNAASTILLSMQANYT